MEGAYQNGLWLTCRLSQRIKDMHGGYAEEDVPKWLVTHLSIEFEDRKYAWRICMEGMHGGYAWRGRTRVACGSPVDRVCLFYTAS